MTRDTDLIRRGDAMNLRDELADVIGARPMSTIHSALSEYRKAISTLPAHPVQEPPGPGVTAGARVSGWQPIETAPKDRVTEVLMYDPGLGMAVWPSSSSPWPNVTHWMPLPEPPAALLPAGEGE